MDSMPKVHQHGPYRRPPVGIPSRYEDRGRWKLDAVLDALNTELDALNTKLKSALGPGAVVHEQAGEARLVEVVPSPCGDGTRNNRSPWLPPCRRQVFLHHWTTAQ